MPEITLQIGADSIGVAQALKQAGLVGSTSEAFRLIEGGGLKLDGERVSDRGLTLAKGAVVVAQAGKRKFARIRLA
jgi:tyrosyl-tRNA synthetase